MELETAYDGLVQWWGSLEEPARRAQLDRFAVGFAYNSGKMENDEITFHDTREIFDKQGITSYTGSVRTLFEMGNQKVAWDWAMDSLAKGFVFDESFVLEAHRLLTHGTYDPDRWAKGERPGSYKRGEYVTGANEDVGYVASDVPAAMAEFFREVESALRGRNARKNALVIGCYVHAKLVDMHPFADGNGRVSRLLSNIVLLGLGHPPLVVREQDRMAYFGALDAFHAAQDLQPLIAFSKAECIMAWRQA